MFEGLVRQLILGYLGRYVKDLQKEQLKITLWNEEVLLENIELNLEAFDYLQLPFALNQGRVGKLCIKIPWKKLGRDPIIIILEDVFVCTSQRDDQEWNLEAVERREYAGKKAKLAAAELAKLSRCVSDTHVGESFMSYISAKILDSIQVSLRAFHVQYRESTSPQALFGLRFSSLTIMKQNFAGTSNGRVREDQVNKSVEILDLELYLNLISEDRISASLDDVGDSNILSNGQFEVDKSDYILAPVNVSLSLTVNKSVQLDENAPLYSISAEVAGLVISVDEAQIQHILVLYDYLSVCELKEKYGRYRPWSLPISRKLKGWQVAWWQYAQQSVLSDVRKKLKKTSWRYFGQRLSYCRKYVNLYKAKLSSLRQEQAIDESILHDLEQMEKESDIDEILDYRAVAEHELQDLLTKSSSLHIGSSNANSPAEKSAADTHTLVGSRGWLNWLSRGMLGAGGTEDSGQFSGVVSDEVIKDIYEATDFDLEPLSNGDTAATEKNYLFEIKFSVHQISATLRSMKLSQAIVELNLHRVAAESTIWEGSAIINASIDSVEMVSLCDKKAILLMNQFKPENDHLEKKQPSLSFQVDALPVNSEVELSMKVMLQPLEVTCDPEILFNLVEFYNMFRAFKFQHKRVICSLNGIMNVYARLLSKAEYIISRRNKAIWDISAISVIINIPWTTADGEPCNMVLQSEAVHLISKTDSLSSYIEDQSDVMKALFNSDPLSDFSAGLQIQDLYDSFELNLVNFEIRIKRPCDPQEILVFEKCSSSITSASCIVPDESVLKQLEVCMTISSLHVHISPSIYGAVLGLIGFTDVLFSKSESLILGAFDSYYFQLCGTKTADVLSFSVAACLQSVSIFVNLENDGESSSGLTLSLEELDMRYEVTELEACSICLKALKIITFPFRDMSKSHLLFSTGNTDISSESEIDVEASDRSDTFSGKVVSAERFFCLRHEAIKTVDAVCNKCTIWLYDADVHLYPHVVGQIAGFFDRISAYSIPSNSKKSYSPDDHDRNRSHEPDFGFHRFGFSNFLESEFSESANITLDQFPFVTILGSSSLASLHSSLGYGTPDWRSNFVIRERKIGSSKPCTMEDSRAFRSPALRSATNMNAISPSGIRGGTTLLNLNFSGLRIHLHDSSCSLGTITLPILKSSLSIQANSVDALCCTAGLTLMSSWSTPKIHEFLWGSAIPHLSPILNIRFKKENIGQLNSRTEISIAIQHTCCTLPPEFLAIIIGYFSLPDWHLNRNWQSVVEEESDGSIIWKFEILDSVIIVPVERDENQFLSLEMPQLYCSFTNTFSHVLKEIPHECLVQTEKISERNDSLNIFGRHVSLLFLLAKHEGNDLLVFSDKFGHAAIPLISPLSADIWILIPGQSQSSAAMCITPGNICCMVRINECEVLVEDKYFLDGIDALIDVVDEFSMIDEQSQAFTSDVLQFIQSKRVLKKSSEDLRAASCSTFMELMCCTNSMMVKLFRWRTESISLEPIAKADMKLTCSASLQDGMPLRLEFCFSSLVLCSILNAVRLARFTATHPNLSVLDFCFTTDGGMDEFHISFPALDVWLYPFDWIEIINLLTSCAAQLERTSKADASLKNFISDPGELMANPSHAFTQESFQTLMESSPPSKENITYGTPSLIGKSENIGITFHIPAQICRQSEFTKGEVPRQMPGSITSNKVGDHCEFFTITLSSKFSEVVRSGGDVKLTLKLDKMSGTIGVYEDNDVRSWPFFEMFVCFLGLDFSNEKKLPYLRVVIQSERLDVCLSHQVFLFWHGVTFKVPDSRSQFAFSGVELEIQFKKVSLLLTDGRWSCNGPLLEVLMRKSHLCANVTEASMQGSITSDLLVNYNNISKVVWEPFVEPTKFQLSVIRRRHLSALLNSCMATDIQVEFMEQLNLNLTDSLIECIFRATEMIKDALGLKRGNKAPDSQKSPFNPGENIGSGRYAPYIVENLTSLPLVFRVLEGMDNFAEVSEKEDGKFLEPGCSVPIYINVTPEEQLSRYRLVSSSDRLSEKQLEGVFHHFITIQFEGTLVPSAPISMDLVGVTYFEADFSKASSKEKVKGVGNGSPYGGCTPEKRTDASSSFFSPVVFDVSVQRYSKLIRLYSTVILSNRTLVPLELRFDIPFGFSPKVLDPIYPGQEFPLPLHLAEAGTMRWRPLGRTYLWSEAHNLSNIPSRESRSGFLRSFVCYPSNPTTDPFRCCISVQDISLPPSGCLKKCPSLQSKGTVKQSVEHCAVMNQKNKSKERFIHRVSFSTPLLVKNFLPETVSLTIESSGVRRTALLSEVETSFFHIDSSHDLDMAFVMHDLEASSMKFPRPETFCAMAKFNGTTFSTCETMTFDSDSRAGPVSVMVEKLVDSSSAAREVCIFVPFLLYNCTDVPLILSETNVRVDTFCAIPSCYNFVEQDLIHGRKDGLGLLSGNKDSCDEPLISDDLSFSSKHHVVSSSNVISYPRRFLRKPALSSGLSTILHEKSSRCISDDQDLKSPMNESSSTDQLNDRESDVIANEHGKVKPCMYFPKSESHASEVMVRLSSFPPDHPVDSIPNSSWSSPFFLQPNGPTTVVIPQRSKNAASIVSVTSSEISGPTTGRTRVITFQPRYVISNACSKDLCYKQKGTDFSYHLGVGQHSHLRWTDTTRELLFSIRFSEPGWQWSGSFFPDHLGDTQVKMRNYASGVLSMTRIEVQHADVSLKDEKIFGSLHGKSGTNLIIISDDDTGFMPYRIDNFTKEKIRIYQQKCDAFETTVHSYSSCPYAWDEPCYPHRLAVEVPGERVLGLYTLDDVKEYTPVQLASNSEKAERTLLISVHAEGAMKVLSIVDSDHHVFNDKKESRVPWYGEKGEQGRKSQKLFNYMEKVSIRFPYVGISVVDSYPQELIFACVRDIRIDLLQSLDQQKLFFQISSLQIDNQLQNTPFPVILSFDHVYRILPSSSTRSKDDGSSGSHTDDSFPEPVLCLAVTKWRNQDIALISFEYVNLRIAEFSLELEQEVLLSLFDFFRAVFSRFHGEVLQYDGSTLASLNSHANLLKESSTHGHANECLEMTKNWLVSSSVPLLAESYKCCPSLPSVVPIGAPWQQIYLLARRQKKIYVEMFELAPIKLTLSFSSTPWKLGHGILASRESLIHRGLMAFADIDGAHINLRQLTIAHHLASCESIQEILVRHYTRQLLHEMYKVLGSAGVIGNPLGFARSLGLGIKDFLSVPARSSLQNPTGIITGMAKGTTSLLSNTVYAISDAATQMSKAAHKGILAFTFDDQAVSTVEKQQKGLISHSKGIVNEVLEGLTGLLQLPIKGAEKHGLPGVVSGIALGVTGLVARPAASILEVTGKTAQSIRKRSETYRAGSQRLRARLPRPIDKELPLRTYSWEEAVGTSVLLEADEGLKYKDEALVVCKALQYESKFAILTKRLILIVSCLNLVDFGKPEVRGFPADPEWVVESEIGLESVIHMDNSRTVVHIVGSSLETLSRQKRGGIKTKRWSNTPTPLPLSQTNLEFSSDEEAQKFLQFLLATIDQGKEQGWGSGHLIHQSRIR